MARSRYLSPADRRALEGATLPARPVRTGTELVREGAAHTEDLFIVLNGWACRYTTSSEGACQLPALLLSGDIANLDSLMFDRLDYGVRTLSGATIAILPRDRALALAELYPGIANTFTWLSLVENVMLSKRALSLCRQTARQRLAHLLCELSVRADGHQGNFEHPLTQGHMADALGLTAVHINRTMQELRQEGLIVTSGRRMTLPDVARLRQISGFDPDYLHIQQPANIQ